MSARHIPAESSPGAEPVPVASSSVQLFRRPTLLWGADDLAAGARATTTWLWHGYLALGGLTLLFGRLPRRQDDARFRPLGSPQEER